MTRRILATLPDHQGQVLVTEWLTGDIEVCWRQVPGDRWGPPATTGLGSVSVETDADYRRREPPVIVTRHRHGADAFCFCGWQTAGRSPAEASRWWAQHWLEAHVEGGDAGRNMP